MNLNEISRNFLCYFFQFAIKFYYFEIKQEDGNKKYGKSKEHRPNPIIQMDMFMDGDGIPLAFSTFAENINEQTSLKPLEKRYLESLDARNLFTAVMQTWIPNLSVNTTIWGNVLIS